MFHAMTLMKLGDRDGAVKMLEELKMPSNPDKQLVALESEARELIGL
ncbi:MAG: hypothetical protein ABL921_18385 [Pirellula sp.]